MLLIEWLRTTATGTSTAATTNAQPKIKTKQIQQQQRNREKIEIRLAGLDFDFHFSSFSLVIENRALQKPRARNNCAYPTIGIKTMINAATNITSRIAQ